MSDLISKIRSAQIRAGEDAVCDHLREMGLLDDQKPIAGVHRPMTAVEVAEDLEAGLNSYGSCSLAAKLLRQQHAEIERLTAERDAAIAAAAAEREACAAVCEAISTGLSAYRDGYGASACLEAIRARTKP